MAEEKRKVMGQIEEILKRKGVSPRAASDEELMRKLGEKLETAMPQFVDRLMGGVIAEELGKLGRSQVCRYWRKQDCSKGIGPCRMDCDAYQPCQWWHKRPGIKFTYAIEYLIIGICVLLGITIFRYPEAIGPVLYVWLGVAIISRIQIIYQRRVLRRLAGI